MKAKFGVKKLETWLYRIVQNVFRYLESCRRGLQVCRTDRRTDRTSVSNNAAYQRALKWLSKFSVTVVTSIFMPPPIIDGEGIMFSGCSSVRLSVVRCPSLNTYFAWHDISILSTWILMKLATNIHYLNGNCRNSFQGQRSKIKVMTRRISLFIFLQSDSE